MNGLDDERGAHLAIDRTNSDSKSKRERQPGSYSHLLTTCLHSLHSDTNLIMDHKTSDGTIKRIATREMQRA